MKVSRDMSEQLDLSFLSPEEEAVIRQVLLRDEDLKRLENKRLRRLRLSIPDPKHLKVLSGEWFEELKSKRYGRQHDVTVMVRASMRRKKTAGPKSNPFTKDAVIEEEENSKKEEHITVISPSADSRYKNPAFSEETHQLYKDDNITLEDETSHAHLPERKLRQEKSDHNKIYNPFLSGTETSQQSEEMRLPLDKSVEEKYYNLVISDSSHQNTEVDPEDSSFAEGIPPGQKSPTQRPSHELNSTEVLKDADTFPEPRRKVSIPSAIQKDTSFEENWVKISLEANTVVQPQAESTHTETQNQETYEVSATTENIKTREMLPGSEEQDESDQYQSDNTNRNIEQSVKSYSNPFLDFSDNGMFHSPSHESLAPVPVQYDQDISVKRHLTTEGQNQIQFSPADGALAFDAQQPAQFSGDPHYDRPVEGWESTISSTTSDHDMSSVLEMRAEGPKLDEPTSHSDSEPEKETQLPSSHFTKGFEDLSMIPSQDNLGSVDFIQEVIVQGSSSTESHKPSQFSLSEEIPLSEPRDGLHNNLPVETWESSSISKCDTRTDGDTDRLLAVQVGGLKVDETACPHSEQGLELSSSLNSAVVRDSFDSEEELSSSEPTQTDFMYKVHSVGSEKEINKKDSGYDVPEDEAFSLKQMEQLDSDEVVSGHSLSDLRNVCSLDVTEEISCSPTDVARLQNERTTDKSMFAESDVSSTAKFTETVMDTAAVLETPSTSVNPGVTSETNTVVQMEVESSYTTVKPQWVNTTIGNTETLAISSGKEEQIRSGQTQSGNLDRGFGESGQSPSSSSLVLGIQTMSENVSHRESLDSVPWEFDQDLSINKSLTTETENQSQRQLQEEALVSDAEWSIEDPENECSAEVLESNCTGGSGLIKHELDKGIAGKMERPGVDDNALSSSIIGAEKDVALLSSLKLTETVSSKDSEEPSGTSLIYRVHCVGTEEDVMDSRSKYEVYLPETQSSEQVNQDNSNKFLSDILQDQNKSSDSGDAHGKDVTGQIASPSADEYELNGRDVLKNLDAYLNQVSTTEMPEPRVEEAPNDITSLGMKGITGFNTDKSTERKIVEEGNSREHDLDVDRRSSEHGGLSVGSACSLEERDQACSAGSDIKSEQERTFADVTIATGYSEEGYIKDRSDLPGVEVLRTRSAEPEKPSSKVPLLRSESDGIPSILIDQPEPQESNNLEKCGHGTSALEASTGGATINTWEQDERVDLEDDQSSVSSYNSELSARRDFSGSALSLSNRTGSLLSIYSDAGDFGNVVVQGAVEFALMYSPAGELIIRVEQCQDLAIANIRKQRTDPYVKTYLYPDKSRRSKRKTSIKKRTVNPVYVETLRYQVKREELPTKTLNLSVWHNDSRGRNVFLGQVELNLRTWDWGHEALTWYNLEPKNKEDSQEYHGWLSVSLKYVPPESTGSSKRGTGEIHVWLREARELRCLKSQGVDSFVKCYMLPDTSKKSRQKTRVVKKSQDPVYNHTMVYDGFRVGEVREACCELTVWDHHTLSNQFLGGVRLSLGTGQSYGKKVDWMDSVNEEVQIWEKMLANPNSWVEGKLPLRSSMTPKT